MRRTSAECWLSIHSSIRARLLTRLNTGDNSKGHQSRDRRRPAGRTFRFEHFPQSEFPPTPKQPFLRSFFLNVPFRCFHTLRFPWNPGASGDLADLIFGAKSAPPKLNSSHLRPPFESLFVHKFRHFSADGGRRDPNTEEKKNVALRCRTLGSPRNDCVLENTAAAARAGSSRRTANKLHRIPALTWAANLAGDCSLSGRNRWKITTSFISLRSAHSSTLRGREPAYAQNVAP